MTVAHINDKIEVLRQTIYAEIHHRILLSNTGKPDLNDVQLFFLLLPFLHGEKLDERMLKSIASVGIVHASLDEHDKIRENSSEDKVQQLTVLSGDYYSGRYYEILAKIGDISLIQHLSAGIVAWCEQNVKIYEMEKMTVAQWVHYFTVTESELICQFYDSIQYPHFKELARQALTAVRLKEVIGQLSSEDDSILIQHIQQSSVTSDQLASQLALAKQSLNSLLQESSLQQELVQWIKEQCLA